MRAGRVNMTGDSAFVAMGVVFDPATLTVISLGATAAGGALSASSTLAGGDYAKDAADFRANQLRQNAGQALASSQRQMFDTQEKTRLTMARSTARAAASGFDAGVGNPAENQGELAERGEYHALMDLFNGESAASGFENQARASEYEGTMKKRASELAAAGTLASTAGSMASTYGKFKYPTARGGFGA